LIEHIAHLVDADLAFLHGFEQSRLGLGWGPIDLVTEQQVREHRPTPKFETTIALIVDR
jgi:hypothetical protein